MYIGSMFALSFQVTLQFKMAPLIINKKLWLLNKHPYVYTIECEPTGITVLFSNLRTV